jgi:phosphotransferase system HPr (HPr) family protein
MCTGTGSVNANMPTHRKNAYAVQEAEVVKEHVMERTVTLGSKSGLHARPAAIIVQNATGFQSKITLSKNDKTVNAKSILSVLTLGAEQGEQVVLKAEGDDAELALHKLASLLEEDLG